MLRRCAFGTLNQLVLLPAFFLIAWFSQGSILEWEQTRLVEQLRTARKVSAAPHNPHFLPPQPSIRPPQSSRPALRPAQLRTVERSRLPAWTSFAPARPPARPHPST
jgi:hypothetical protein